MRPQAQGVSDRFTRLPRQTGYLPSAAADASGWPSTRRDFVRWAGADVRSGPSSAALAQSPDLPVQHRARGPELDSSNAPLRLESLIAAEKGSVTNHAHGRRSLAASRLSIVTTARHRGLCSCRRRPVPYRADRFADEHCRTGRNERSARGEVITPPTVR